VGFGDRQMTKVSTALEPISAEVLCYAKGPRMNKLIELVGK
jgi:hypothetical protein